MSVAAAHAVKPPAFAPAAPVQRKAEPTLDRDETPRRLLTSLSAVPGVQRACAGCSGKDNEPETQVMPKLEVGPVDDPYEREADDIAGRVMAMRGPGQVQRATPDDDEPVVMARRFPVQRKCATCDDEEMPRMRADNPAGTEHIAASAPQLTSGGNALSPHTREFFEGRMGRDLSDVRIHRDKASEALNGSISSRAFTFRNHIWLGGAESEGPSFTMAHELAHVLQQTQPGPTSDHDTVNRAPARVQRNYWQPLGSSNIGPAATRRHEQIHDDYQNALKRTNRSLFLEVPIPGATARNRYPTACGFADLYKADNANVPGLEVDENTPFGLRRVNWRGNCGNNNWFRRMTQAESRRHQRNAYPRLNRRRDQVTFCDRAPTNIGLGDVKPGHNENERDAGQGQLARYIRGLNDNAAAINAKSAGCYSPNPGYLQEQDLNQPPDWDPGRPSGDWTIPQLEFRRNRLGRRRVFRPFGATRQSTGRLGRIRGRYSGVKDKKYTNGIWVYFIEPHPDDVAAALGRSSSQRSGFRVVGQDLQRILNCLRSTPATSARLCRRPRDSSSTSRHTSRHLAVRSVRADAGQPRVRRNMRRRTRDHFDLNRWNAMRRGGAGAPAQYANNNLDATLTREITEEQREAVLFQGAAIDGKSEFDQNFGTRNSFDLPASARSAAPGSALNNSRLLERAEFWTGRFAGIFGRLRQKLGRAFGKSAELYDKFRTKARDVFKNRSFRGGKSNALAAAAKQAAGMVLRVIGSMVLKRVANGVMGCLESGFSAYVRREMSGDGIDALHEKALAAQTRVTELRDDVFGDLEAMANSAIEPLKGKVEQITTAVSIIGKIVGAATTIAHGLRIGTCLAGLSAAAVGAVVTCLLSLGDFVLSLFGASPIDWLAGKLIKSCESQKLIGRAMLANDKIRNLPQWATKEIVERLRGALPDGVKDIFCNPDDIEIEEMKIEELNCGEGAGYARELQDSIASDSESQQGDANNGRSAEEGTPSETSEIASSNSPNDDNETGTGAGAGTKSVDSSVQNRQLITGDPAVGGIIIESGINPRGTYRNSRVSNVRVTVSIPGHVFRNVPVRLIVRELGTNSSGQRYALCYFPADVAITFRNDYSNGTHYEWSPDRGPSNSNRFIFRSVP